MIINGIESGDSIFPVRILSYFQWLDAVERKRTETAEFILKPEIALSANTNASTVYNNIPAEPYAFRKQDKIFI